MSYDLLIKGGRIYDGSGLPSYAGSWDPTNLISVAQDFRSKTLRFRA